MNILSILSPLNCLVFKKKILTGFPKYLFILFLFFAELSYAQQQWYSTYVPRNRHVNSLKFLSHDDILFGGGNEFNGSLQELWISHDKGLEWENVNNVHTEAWIKSMAFADTLQGFAVGDSATILKTSDGAHFWTLLPRPIQNREFTKIIYVTPKILFIVGGSIPYPELIPGGSGHVDTMQTIVKSTDGGNTWTVVLDRKGFWLNGVSFTDSLHGIVVGDKGNILRTVDGGTNWTTIAPPVVRNFNAVKFISPTVGYIVGGINHRDPFTLLYVDSLSTILRTNNGGASWTVLKDDLNGILNDITFSSSNIGYIVGDKATLLKTTNAGLNWTPVVVPGAGSDQTFNCVEFKNDNLGMIGARDGYLHIYTTSALASAYTYGAKYVDSTVVTMFGGVKTHGDIATYTFLISLDSTFTNFSYVFEHPGDIQSDSFISMIQGDTPGWLTPHTKYYYAVQARTLAGYSNGDTLAYIDEPPNYIFQTVNATNTSSLGASLNGIVNKLPTSATLSFEYGTTQQLGNEISAVPLTINDSLSHNVTAVLNDLLPNTTYFYRLRGEHNGQSYFGDFQVLTTTSPIQTMPATDITKTSATLNGYIDKFGVTANVSFDYGTSLSFGNEIASVPATINDTFAHIYSAALNNLTQNTTYYFRLKAVHGSDIYYSNPQQFTTLNPFQTLPPTNITTKGATLNGLVDKVDSSVAISFEYGISSSFGNEIVAVPDSVNDTLLHYVSASLNNLQSNKLYYYRIKGTHNSQTYYGYTQTFNTDNPFHTLPASNVSTTSATLNGSIIKSSDTVIIHFEYGTSSSFGNEITATDSMVNDTLSHSVSAVLNNLDSNTTYYFRLKAKHDTSSFYGDTQTFFTGRVFKTFQTLPATNVLDSIATLNGIVDKFLVPVNLRFEYGTTPGLGYSVSANPSFVADTFQYPVFIPLSGLLPNTQYYFRLTGQTAAITYYGDILVFHTGISFSFLNTLDATNITPTSAQLNGRVAHLSSDVTLSFEWGPTTAFGNIAIANPGAVTDTLTHDISANLFGLTQGQVYYYRLKVLGNGTTVYGDTKQFYPGFPEIPNWDFQYWVTDSANIPRYWNNVSSEFERVPGHSGNYAIKIRNQNLLMNGSIKDDLSGGVPLNVSSRPDSVVAFINYSVEAGDSALMGVILKKQGLYIAQNMYVITGNSGGVFNRMAYPLHYDSLVVPDSVVYVFLTTNIIERVSTSHNNFLIIDDISFLPGNTPFANSGFEDWFPTVIENPIGWFNYQYSGLDPLQPDNHMVSKVYFNAPNDYAAQIQNMNWDGVGVFTGGLYIHNGVLDNKTGGFPVIGKHLTFNGYYKYFPAPGDTMRISVSMNKGRNGVGYADFFQPDSVTEFTPFSMPIIYFDNTIPDSADLEISCTNGHSPKLGTKLIIDKLSFDGFISGIPYSKNDQLELDGMKVYPNPARDILIIENLLHGNKECSLSLFSISGQLINEIKLPAGQHISQMEVGDLSPGFYLLTMKKGDKMYTKKIVIQK